MLRCAIKYGSLGNPRLLLVGKKPIIRMYGGSASSFKRGIVTDVTFLAVPLCAMGHKVSNFLHSQRFKSRYTMFYTKYQTR